MLGLSHLYQSVSYRARVLYRQELSCTMRIRRYCTISQNHGFKQATTDTLAKKTLFISTQSTHKPQTNPWHNI